jgi:Na+/proline symporter
MPPVLTGVIIADIFATIAATANSLIIAMSQTARFDLLGLQNRGSGNGLLIPAIVIGLGTMGISLMIQGSVVTLALSSVAVMGAGLAPSVLAQLFRWKPGAATVAASIAAGATAAVAWKIFGLDAILNEALPGMLVGLAIHCVSRFVGSRSGSPGLAAGRA